MKTSGNTILITGGGSGIGRGLAEAFHALGNQVIISGRRQEVLDATVSANPGMKSIGLNVENPVAIRSFAEKLTSEFPDLNVLINNAGIMKFENLLEQPEDLAIAEATVTTNLLGPIRLTAALLPYLQQQSHSTIINVSSGIAFVPLAITPTYSATKAALHAYTESLRYQLRNTTTQVIELIPPGVQTDLLGGIAADDPRMMPLDAFISESMEILKSQPSAVEICVENVKPMRYAKENGQFEVIFEGINQIEF